METGLTLPRKDKRKVALLSKLKKELVESFVSVQYHISRIMEILYEIKTKKLYHYDECGSLREFILRHDLEQKLNLKYSTITNYLKLIEYSKEIGLKSEEVTHIGFSKLGVMRRSDINDANKARELSKQHVNEIKYTINLDRNPVTGRIMGKHTPVRRPDTVIKIYDLEIPTKNAHAWESALLELCKDLDIVIRENLQEKTKKNK